MICQRHYTSLQANTQKLHFNTEPSAYKILITTFTLFVTRTFSSHVFFTRVPKPGSVPRGNDGNRPITRRQNSNLTSPTCGHLKIQAVVKKGVIFNKGFRTWKLKTRN